MSTPTDPPAGEPPAVALIDPKYPQNVGMVVRLASCYGFKQVWFTGERVSLNPMAGERLPREERMKGYRDVRVVHHNQPFDHFPADATPVAVEVRASAEGLHEFEHPPHPLYVFGPEDGSIPKPLLGHCHRFVVIPTRHCLNLATAVATVLWDRQYKRWRSGDDEAPPTPGEYVKRGVYETPDDVAYGGR